MDDFTKLVERCAKNLENHTIFNASTAHAIILFKNLLEVAAREKRPVKIFSGRFDCSVYETLVEPLKKAIAAGVEIVLICEFAPDANNSFVNTASQAKVRIENLNRKTGFPHFILVGESSYRVELDDVLRSARANFDDTTTGKTILTLYNRLLSTQA